MDLILFTLLIILNLIVFYFIDENFTNDKYNKIIILYHVDWCGFCKLFKPTWIELQNDNKLNNILFIDVNMTNENKIITNNKNIKLDDNILDKIQNVKINGYPTIKLLSNNNLINYENNREYNDIINFIENN